MYSQIVGEVPHGQNRGDIRQISSHGFPPYSFDAEFSQKFQKLTIFCLLYFGPEISTTPSCLSLHARQFLPTGGKARREHVARICQRGLMPCPARYMASRPKRWFTR